MFRLLLTAALAAPLLHATPVFAEVEGAWVRSDRTVDCSSYESIAQDVLRPDMTDEEKAIALYEFFRQRVYHFQNLPESREPLKTVNVLGNTLCGSQATCMKGLLEGVAGLKTRVVSHPGHTFYEVFYDGKWHGFDTMTNFYVFTRGEGKDRNVASFAELKEDPSLITAALEEGRAVQAICPCGDTPESFAAKIHVLNYEPRRSDWSVKDYSLRRGEELVRSWWPHGKVLPGSAKAKYPNGPVHTCGTRDRRAEPEMFRLWEPYGIPKFSPSTSVSYRHYFNGWIAYSPDLTSDEAVRDGGAELEGVTAGPKGLSGAGTWKYDVKSPFHITGADLHLDAACPAAGDAIVVEVSDSHGKWQEVAKLQETKVETVSLDKQVVKAKVGRYGYGVRIRVEGNATLKNQYLRTWFQHNAMAAPHLEPGKNVVTVEVADQAPLEAAPLMLVYRYKDAPQWDGEVRTIEKQVTRNGQKLEITVPESKKLPQMQELTLRYGKLAWRPESTNPAATAITKGE